jgi:hypothetical protein
VLHYRQRRFCWRFVLFVLVFGVFWRVLACFGVSEFWCFGVSAVLCAHLEAPLPQLIHFELEISSILNPSESAGQSQPYDMSARAAPPGRQAAKAQRRLTCCSDVDPRPIPVPPITCCLPDTETCRQKGGRGKPPRAEVSATQPHPSQWCCLSRR